MVDGVGPSCQPGLWVFGMRASAPDDSLDPQHRLAAREGNDSQDTPHGVFTQETVPYNGFRGLHLKKLLWLLALMVVATAMRDVVRYFGPMAAAYRNYRDEATAATLARGKTKAFRDIEGHIIDVSYHLESAEPAGEDQVRLVVVEAIQFQKVSEMGPFGNRRVARTRQHVTMSHVDGAWIVSHVEQDATEVGDLSEIDFDDG